MTVDSKNITAELIVKSNGETKSIQLPVIRSSIGEPALDITSLHKKMNIFSYDPGYMSTASCQSSITYINGDAGVLMHRGYDIKDLVAKKSFVELSYLLINRSFPDQNELGVFNAKLIESMEIAADRVVSIMAGFNRKAHPMSILIATLARLSSIFNDADYAIKDHAEKQKKINDGCILAIGKMAALIANIYRYSISKKPIFPKKEFSFTENLLYMMLSNDGEDYTPSKEACEAIDKLLILHADHEQNASTSAVRSVASTGSNMFASIISGVCALWGPLHGGANEAVIKMLEEIKKVENIDKYIQKAESGEVKLMGFGHRIYKNHDPRAVLIKEYCDKLIKDDSGNVSDLLKVAKEIEKRALNEEYFKSRKLFPNVDFYSGIIYTSIGIPPVMFTPMFAISRVAGWVSQRKELLNDEEFKISRPRQVYIGEVNKNA